MAYVKVKNGNLSSAINAFNSKVHKEGILKQYMENQYYEKPSDKKRREKKRQNFYYKLRNQHN